MGRKAHVSLSVSREAHLALFERKMGPNEAFDDVIRRLLDETDGVTADDEAIVTAAQKAREQHGDEQTAD